jgi:hypothetical protein
MTLFSAATTAALNAPPNGIATTLLCYKICVEFPVKESLSNALNLLQKLLSALVGSTLDILFYDSSSKKINIKEFPKEKA